MHACPGDDTITLMVCGQLEGARVAAVESHAADCPSCRKIVEILTIAMSSRGGEALRANAIGLLPPGTLVGRYQIVDLLGAGGMGVVYAAHDPELDRRVALKLLYPTLSPDGDDELAVRLRHESKAMARLRHPNVATIHDLGSYRDQLFLVMELVDGETLRAWVGRGKPWATVVAAFAQAGKGLAAAHDAGIVHCDFKPDNVLLDVTGRPLITDFGLAHVVAGSSRPSLRDIHVATALGSSALIDVDGGPVFGTPAYMAPERFDATIPADAQGDVFAFCVALYEVLHGRRPFEGTTVDELRTSIATAPRPPDDTAVPMWLHAAIVRGLSVDRDVRYRSMTELLAALEPTPRPARARWIAGLVGMAAVAGVVGWQALAARATGAPVICDARAELAGSWDDAARDRIRAAWTATPAGQLAWPRVQRALDGYADAWVSASDASCRAPSAIASVAEFQHRCLRGISVDLRAFTDQLVDPSVIATADRKVSSLPSVEDCNSSAPVSPVPSDPWARVEVDRLRDELASATGQSIAGKFDSASASLDAVAKRAAMAGFKPLIAEIGYERAMNMRGTPIKPEARIAAMRETAAQAEASGDEPLAVKAWIGLAFEAGETNADYARGHEYTSYARAALERLGGNQRLEAQLAIEDGRLFWHEHKLDDARRELGHAADLAKADPVFYVDALAGLALVDTASGRYADALDEHRHVLELRRKLYGDAHPAIASSYTSLGDITIRMGKLDESLEYYKKADAVAQQVFGPDHVNIQMTAHNLGGIYGELGRIDDAERELRRAVRIGRTALGPDHPYTVKSELSLGMTLLDRNKFDEAIGLMRHALAIDLAAYGEHGFETVTVDDDLGVALRAAGKLDEALVYADKAVAGYTALDGGPNAAVAQAYDAKARVLLAMHRTRDAVAAFETSADVYSHTQAPAKSAADERALADKARGTR